MKEGGIVVRGRGEGGGRGGAVTYSKDPFLEGMRKGMERNTK